MKQNLAGNARFGIWLLGAKGGVAVASVAGVAAIIRGLADTTGMVTELGEYGHLQLPKLESLIFGGHDIRETEIIHEARHLNQSSSALPETVLDMIKDELVEYESRIRPGLTIGMDSDVLARLGSIYKDSSNDRSAFDGVTRIREDLRCFREINDLDYVVVVNLMSSEPGLMETGSELQTIDAFEEALHSGGSRALGLSTLYTYAAFKEKCSFVNFTPSIANDAPALQQLALSMGVPHAGKDGKTGETLIKSQLAPMFSNRNLRVHSWVGYNILGNRDGRVLQDESVKKSKIGTKDSTLKSIIRPNPTTLVGIDYVPSLGDNKIAWDYIHFSGWLGSQGKLTFQWEAADSFLAAPLIVDLARLMGLAMVNGESGIQSYLAHFFKAPMASNSYDFDSQCNLLKSYLLGE